MGLLPRVAPAASILFVFWLVRCIVWVCYDFFFSASYPGQFALSELPEAAWNLARILGEFSRQVWQVASHPKSPRTTGNEAAFFFIFLPVSFNSLTKLFSIKISREVYIILYIYWFVVWICYTLQGINLDSADLSKLDLRFINFKMANLKKTDLANANLSNCCLERANLSGAHMDVSLFLQSEYTRTQKR